MELGGDTERASDDPNLVVCRDREDDLAAFMQNSDAPAYKNEMVNELRRKQDADKSISLTFQTSKFGGDVEEDWKKHLADFETIALDNRLRSKDLAY